MLGSRLIAACLVPFLQVQEPAPILVPGSTISGRITPDCAVIHDEHLVQRFCGGIRRAIHPVTAEGDHAIELSSPDFDPWLVVRNEAGTIVAEVLGTRERPAIVVVSSRAAEPLRVEAAALRGGAGAYTLRCAVATPSLRASAELSRRWATLTEAEQREDPEDELLAKALDAVGKRLWGLGRYEEALPLMQRQLTILERVYGPRHEQTAFALSQTAAQWFGLGRFEEAESFFRRALAIREEVHGPHHARVADTLGYLTALLHAQGRNVEAEPIARRALAIHEQPFGAEHAELDDHLHNLGSVLFAQGKYGEAEGVCRRLLAIRERELGPSHDATALVLSNLAVLVGEQSRHAEAEVLLRRAISAGENEHGSESPALVAPLTRLALLLQRQSKDADASEVLRRALAIDQQQHGPRSREAASSARSGDALLAMRLLELAEAERRLGPEHPDLTDRLDQVGYALWRLDRFADALPFMQRQLAIVERTYGLDHEQTAFALTQVGAQLWGLDRFGEALPIMQRFLAITERAHGAEHEKTAYAHEQVAAQLSGLARYGEAEAHTRRALAIYERVHGTEHPEVGSAMETLASILHAQGRLAAADLLRCRARSILGRHHSPGPSGGAGAAAMPSALAAAEAGLAAAERRFAPDDPRLAEAINSLGYEFWQLHRYADALPLMQRQLAILERVFGTDHERTVLAVHQVAAQFAGLGRDDEAEDLYRRALASREKMHGPGHRFVAESMVDLALFLDDRGEFLAAESLYRRALSIRSAALGPQHPDVLEDIDRMVLTAGNLGRHAEAWALSLQLCDAGMGHLVDELSLTPTEDRFRLSADQANRVDRLLSCLPVVGGQDERLDLAWQQITAWKGALFRLARRLVDATAASAELDPMRAALRAHEAELSHLTYAREIADPIAHAERFQRVFAEHRRAQAELLSRLAIQPARERTNARELGRLLPAGSALLDFVLHTPLCFARIEGSQVVERMRLGEPRFLCFVLRADAEQPVLIDLGDAGALRDAIEAWLAALAPCMRGRTPGGEEPQSSARVREWLWQPLARHLAGVDHVFVCADDVLTLVPFGAIEVAKGRFAIEIAQFVAVQDPVTLREMLANGRRERAVNPALLAVGAVDYTQRAGEDANAAARLRTTDRSDPGDRGFDRDWKWLEHTGPEAATVEALWGQAGPGRDALALRGAHATEEAFAQAARGRTVLHLATHGFFERDGIASLWESALGRARAALARHASIGAPIPVEPAIVTPAVEPPGLLAGLVLAGANASPPPGRGDGVLTADEVAALPLQDCELAVLSACETALGSARSGEGLVSLRRAFAEAGAQTVVSTLWRISDEAASRLVERFYRGLWLEGKPAAVALRDAQLWMLGGGARNEWRDPRYWAPWLLAGEWR